MPDINLDDYDIEMHSEDEIMDLENSSDECDDDDDDEIPSKIMKSISSPLWVLPLYSMLPAHKQTKVICTIYLAFINLTYLLCIIIIDF